MQDHKFSVDLYTKRWEIDSVTGEFSIDDVCVTSIKSVLDARLLVTAVFNYIRAKTGVKRSREITGYHDEEQLSYIMGILARAGGRLERHELVRAACRKYRMIDGKELDRLTNELSRRGFLWIESVPNPLRPRKDPRVYHLIDDDAGFSDTDLSDYEEMIEVDSDGVERLVLRKKK